MTNEEWESLTTEEQEAHTKAFLDRMRRSRNREVLEILKFAEAVEQKRLIEMSVGYQGCGGDGVHELNVKVIFE